MNRKTIIVDLDNVVYDWCRSMANWLDKNNALHGYSPHYVMRQYKNWAVWDDWGIPKGEFIRWWRLGIEAEEIYAKGPIIAGARDALWRLSDFEWNIHIATSRLTKFGLHDKIVENTSHWLRDNNIPYRELSFTSNKKSIIADAIVDDRADNMNPDVHNMCFLFPAPHNGDDTKPRVVWENIVEKLT